MFRRSFIGKSIAATAATLLANVSAHTAPASQEMVPAKKKLIWPKPMPEKATVALVAPSSPPALEKITKAVANLTAMGFTVKEGRHLRDQYGYLAGKDQDRAADLHAAFADPEVDAVWCVRGGYGCTRLLPLLDFDLIRANAKPLIGYSDITALHIALLQEAKVVSFHGQVGGGDMTEFTLSHIQRTLMLPRKNPLEIPPFATTLQATPTFEPYTIQAGQATGPLIGGNLTLLAVMNGTAHAPVFKDHIVFMEEIGEAPYRIDRMLTQLLQGSDLRKAKGIVVGICADCIQKGDTPTLSLRECLQDRLGDLGIPVYYGAPFGHISNQCVLPYGATASMDAGQMTLTLHP